jgi:flavin reductase (DIM6/NTAB) family NADH-FMN oxidoreductase RutF/rubredoxin
MEYELIQSTLDFCSYGLYIIGSNSKDKINAQISDAIMQVTAVPPKIAISICQDELTHEYIQKSAQFSISILKKSTSLDFVRKFGFQSGRDVNKFENVKHFVTKNGLPIVLENTVAICEASVINAINLKTHTLFIADVISAKILSEDEVLTYRYYQNVLKGKVNKNAPSFHTKEEIQIVDDTKKQLSQKYICKICGYVYDPENGDSKGKIEKGTPFEKLPDTWKCPICQAGKENFVPYSKK